MRLVRRARGRRRIRRFLLSAAAGLLAAPPAADAIPGDAAPGTRGPDGFCPAPDGAREVGDALVILRRAVGLIPHWDCGFDDARVDLAPAARVDADAGGVPVWRPAPDGRVEPADALIALRDAIGTLRIEPANPRFVIPLDTIPEMPAVGGVDCDGDGTPDPPTDTVLRSVAATENPPFAAYQVCLWRKRDARDFDFDAPPFGNFPGAEDHDAGDDGVLLDPPAPDACATVCPAGVRDPGCADTSSAGGGGVIVEIGPFAPEGPADALQAWSLVVDPGFALDDADFADNVSAPFDVEVARCPILRADLAPASAIRVLPADADQDDELTFEVRIENRGDRAVDAPFDVDLYVDPQPAHGLPTPSSPTPVPAGDSFRSVLASPQTPLLPGDDALVAFDDFDPAPGSVQRLKLPPGLHGTMVLVDSVGTFGKGSVPESDETNNLFPDGFADPGGAFCIGSGRGFGGPDLAITRVRFFEPGGSQPACDRAVNDRVDVEVTLSNLGVLPSARDLGLSQRGENLYELLVPDSSLDGLLFDCVPVGVTPAPLRGSYMRLLSDTSLTIAVQRAGAGSPADVDTGNNAVTVPLLNRPPAVDAGPDQSTTAGAALRLDGTASDPNDVPPGSQPLTLRWELVSGPQGATAGFDDPAAEDPLFTADTAGVYTLRLRATDCPGESSSDDVVDVTVAQPTP